MTPGSTAPVLSVTVPLTLPVVPCAKAAVETASATTADTTHSQVRARMLTSSKNNVQGSKTEEPWNF